MKIAVMASPDNFYFTDLRRAAGAAHEIVPVSPTQLSAHIGSSQWPIACSGHSLTTFDALIVRAQPFGSLEQVVFRMDCLWALEARGVVVVNPPKAAETAVDKYLALARLELAGLPVPPTIVCQTAHEARRAFTALGGDVVLKPIFGSEGRGLARLNDPDLADRAFSLFERMGSILYLQPFLAHPGYDLRLLVIGDSLLGIRRHNPNDWRTNLSRGGRAEPWQPDAATAQLAFQAARAIQASVAGVDILETVDGRRLILEINAAPGWRGVAEAHDVDVAQLVIDHVVALVRARQRHS